MSKPKIMVNASDVGKAAYCPHALSLQSRAKSKPSKAALRGTKAHDDLNDYLLNGGDKRCFVASYALGENHPSTHALRLWRDRVLKPFVLGRALIFVYYRLSPAIIRVAGSSYWYRKLARIAVERFASRVISRA